MDERFPKPQGVSSGEKSTYSSFLELSKSEMYGLDFDIQVERRNSRVAIFAPHGGRIEPRTTEIACSLAGNTHSFYSLSGLKKLGNSKLHIKSTAFDEPRALELIGCIDTIVTVHGMKDGDVDILLGGLDIHLVERIQQKLSTQGFKAKIGEHSSVLGGTDPENICNRGISGKGVQIEISKKLRQDLIENPLALEDFRKAVTESFLL